MLQFAKKGGKEERFSNWNFCPLKEKLWGDKLFKHTHTHTVHLIKLVY